MCFGADQIISELKYMVMSKLENKRMNKLKYRVQLANMKFHPTLNK